MNVDAVMRAAVMAATAAGRRAVADAGAALALRATESGLDAEMMDGVVRLRGRALRARAFGSRRRVADPAIAAMVRGDGG